MRLPKALYTPLCTEQATRVSIYESYMFIRVCRCIPCCMDCHVSLLLSHFLVSFYKGIINTWLYACVGVGELIYCNPSKSRADAGGWAHRHSGCIYTRSDARECAGQCSCGNFLSLSLSFSLLFRYFIFFIIIIMRDSRVRAHNVAAYARTRSVSHEGVGKGVARERGSERGVPMCNTLARVLVHPLESRGSQPLVIITPRSYGSHKFRMLQRTPPCTWSGVAKLQSSNEKSTKIHFSYSSLPLPPSLRFRTNISCDEQTALRPKQRSRSIYKLSNKKRHFQFQSIIPTYVHLIWSWKRGFRAEMLWLMIFLILYCFPRLTSILSVCLPWGSMKHRVIINTMLSDNSDRGESETGGVNWMVFEGRVSLNKGVRL